MESKNNIPWWKKGVIYQIYPLSFLDTDGDGIGDLRGIIQKLDYLNDGTPDSLGVDAIWLSPIHPSPWADFGYDVSNYIDIDSRFGNLEIFDQLLKEAHRRNIKVILDFVPNHTSSQHPWFIESRSSKDNPKRDWYIWRDPGSDGGPPTDDEASFGGSTWTKDERTGQYYYHQFLAEQPDVNWRNSQMKEEMFNFCRFWFERGVDGFRFDAVYQMIKERLGLLSAEEFHEIFRTIRKIADEYGDRVLIGETGAPDFEFWARYYGGNLDEIHIPFNFFFLKQNCNAHSMRNIVEKIEQVIPKGAWPNYVLGNHDFSRLATRFGSHYVPIIAVLLLTLRGTPILYYGDEIGMHDVAITEEQSKDPTQDHRDPERTPMQWDDTINAGFSGGKPWLPVSNDYSENNVKLQSGDPTSILSLYRKLMWARKENSALHSGTYEAIDTSSPDCFAYVREDAGRKFLIVLNFSDRQEDISLYSLEGSGNVIISTLLDRNEQIKLDEKITLRPYEGCVVEV